METGEWGPGAGGSQPSPVPPWSLLCCVSFCLPLLGSSIYSPYVSGDQISSRRPPLVGRCGGREGTPTCDSPELCASHMTLANPLNLAEPPFPYLRIRESSPRLPLRLVMNIKQNRAFSPKTIPQAQADALGFLNTHSLRTVIDLGLSNCFLFPRRGFMFLPLDLLN